METLIESFKDLLEGLAGWQRVAAIITIIAILGGIYVYTQHDGSDTPSINQGGSQTSGASSTNAQTNTISI